jgi:ABC-type lipoprotein export system ATPase subunit
MNPDGLWVTTGITVSFTSHHLHAITGPSGSGKPTPLHLLCGGRLLGRYQFSPTDLASGQLRPLRDPATPEA